MALLDDSPSDFDAVTLALAAEDASGFDLAATDLTTSRGSNEILQLIMSGAGGSVAGIATVAAHENAERAREEEREREKAQSSIYVTNEASFSLQSMLNRLEQTFLEKLERNAQVSAQLATEIREKIHAFQQEVNRKYEEGLISKEAHTGYSEFASNMLTQLDEREAQRARDLEFIQADTRSTLGEFISSVQSLKEDPSQSGRTAQVIQNFIEMESELITLQISDQQTNLPMKVAIHKGAGENEYYYMNPRTGDRVNITNENQISIIEAQVKAGSRVFANAPEAEGLAQDFQTLQTTLLDKLAGRPIEASYINAFNDLTRLTLTQTRMAVIDQEMRELREQVNEYASTFSERLAAGATEEELQAEMAQMRASYDEKSQQYATYYSAIQRHMESFDSNLSSLMSRLEEEYAQLNTAIDRLEVNGINNRNEQIRARFPNEWKAPTDWGLPKALQGLAEMTITNWTAEFAASDELERAWKEDVVKDANGNAVYRDNDTLELYTYANGERTYIRDPNTILGLLNEAYPTNPDGTPSANFKFFMNETPYGEDPENTFKESFLANMSTDRVVEHSDQTRTRGQQEYGGQSQPRTEGTQGEQAPSLRPGFELSAAHTWRPWEATVNFARSGFNAGIDMMGSFTNRAAQDTQVQIAELSNTSPSTDLADDGEITPDTGPKTVV